MELQQPPTIPDKAPLADLVRAAQDGDRQAFAELFQRYRRGVYNTVFQRLHNGAEAQELCQDVFVQAMRKIHQLHNPLCFGGWLRSIANRMAINRALRTRSVRSIESDRFDGNWTESETPLGEVLARERRAQVHLGLNRLTELDRETLVAFYFQGRSLVQMSDEFKSPVGTIKRRLHVARKRLAEELAALAPA